MTTTTVQRIPVSLARNPYEVTIGEGSLSSVGSELLHAGIKPGRKVLVVSNAEVSGPYGETVLTSLRQNGFQAELLIIEAGEQQKTPATVAKIHDAAFTAALERSSVMLASAAVSWETWTGFCRRDVAAGHFSCASAPHFWPWSMPLSAAKRASTIPRKI